MIRQTFLLLTTLLLLLLHCMAGPASASSVFLSWPEGQKAIMLTPETVAHHRKLAAQAFEYVPEEVKAAQMSLEERAEYTLQLSGKEAAGNKPSAIAILPHESHVQKILYQSILCSIITSTEFPAAICKSFSQSIWPGGAHVHKGAVVEVSLL